MQSATRLLRAVLLYSRWGSAYLTLVTVYMLSFGCYKLLLFEGSMTFFQKRTFEWVFCIVTFSCSLTVFAFLKEAIRLGRLTHNERLAVAVCATGVFIVGVLWLLLFYLDLPYVYYLVGIRRI